ncbi:LLM class flavin-dependent oxidoreductase [Portibacter lacus]|uniref:Luciferase n=1 Tax=Portibacter lacus TaxID=1099794 RepID=A0AA37STY8_9BACT|nr:LLM class flavin-dependent oxidoreductase [Portibacter lacus]GLR19609.1 luciferase [Portibacter lacus]
MEIGIDSFAASPNNSVNGSKSLRQLIERIELADQAGLSYFGIGEHHRKDFLDSAPSMILASAAARTKNIRLGSAVTVLSASDPVRVFQNYATLDLLSNGRAEIVAGRGSFTDAFPLFGFNLNDYNDLFEEKLNLLLEIRDNEVVNWVGKFRPALMNQSIYPRPQQKKMPIWVGVGGTPSSFERAGKLGLPLMVAIIGGETHRFRPLVDLYKEAGRKAGFDESELKVGMHSVGYIGKTRQEAVSSFYPSYKEMFDKIGRERGFPPVSRAGFDAQNGLTGALLVGEPSEIVDKILRHSEALGGIDRITLQMDAISNHETLMKSIELIGAEIAPKLNGKN